MKYNCSGTEWINDERYVMYVENEKNQRYDSNNINNKFNLENFVAHKNSYISMFENNNIKNKIRIIFSSYSLTGQGTGFPDGFSDFSKTIVGDCTLSINYIKAYDPLSTDMILLLQAFLKKEIIQEYIEIYLLLIL